ncbi:N-acetyltransferase [Deltaproteobacteria bacterium Smac51]|nr:N-acetyltransferase [Deltaproteobacteria bacterium Smac51]
MIRPFQAEDKDIFLTMSDEFYHSEAVDHPVSSENWLRTFDAIIEGQSLAKGWMIIAGDGRPAGYLLASLMWSGEFGGLVCWLEELYVRSDFRGQGLGGQAMKTAMEEVRKKNKVLGYRLEVAPANAGVEEIYQKVGFTRVPYNQWWKAVEVA